MYQLAETHSFKTSNPLQSKGLKNGGAGVSQMRTFFPFEVAVSLVDDSWVNTPEIVWPFASPASSKSKLETAVLELKRKRKESEHPVVVAKKWKSLLSENRGLSVKQIAIYQGCSQPRVNQLLRLTNLELSIQEFLSELSNSKDVRFYGETKLRHLVPLPHAEQLVEFEHLKQKKKSNLSQNESNDVGLSLIHI